MRQLSIAAHLSGNDRHGGSAGWITAKDRVAGALTPVAPTTGSADERAQASCEQPRGPARDCQPVVYTLLATTM